MTFNAGGCTGKGIVPPDTLRYALKSDPMFLNPILASDAMSMTVNGFIFNSLVKYDENMKIIPDLAESWEITDDGTTYIFHLRKGVKWHDGAPFTARDAVFTFRKMLDPSTNTFNAGLFRVDDKDVEFAAEGNYKLIVKTPKPFAPMLNNLSLVPIAPEHLLKDESINLTPFNRKPVGTGPFKFHEWKTSDRITVVANPEYFAGKPKLERIIFKILPSAEGSRIALISNQIDMSALGAEDIFILNRMENRPKHLKVEKWNDFTYFYLAFDLTNPLFSDERIRKAINYAIDRKNLTESVLHGAGTPLAGPLPIPSWAYTADVQDFPYNPEKARSILKIAGWKTGKDGKLYKDGKKFTFTIMYKSGSASSESACIQILSYLSAIGMDVKLQAMDFGALINSLYPNKFQAVVFNWVEPFDPDIFTEWHSSQMGDKGMNFMSYSNPRTDRLLESARSCMEQEKRKTLYHEIQKEITATAPYVFLWNQIQAMGVNERVKGLSRPSPAGLMIHPEKVWVKNRP